MHGGLGDTRAPVGTRRCGVVFGVRGLPLRQGQEVLLESAVLGGRAGLGGERFELLVGGLTRTGAPFEAGARSGRCRRGTGRQLLVVRCQLTYRRGCLCVERRKLFAMGAHTRPQTATWVATEALRHRRVPRGFGCVLLSKGSEVSGEARMITRL